MQCNKCGSTIKDGLKFCTKCGADLILTRATQTFDIEKRYCTNCGELIKNGSFCTNCGAKINDNANVEAKKSNKKKKSPKKKKTVLILIACLVLALGIGGYFGINQLLNTLSGGLEDVGIPESTGSVVVDCSNIYEKATDEESAYEVLNSVSELFGFENAKDVLDIQKTDYVNGDTYYRFAQKYNGIPVYGKSVVLSADEHGNVFNISGNYMAIDDTLNTEPKLKADKAKKKIEKQVKKEIKKGLNVSEPQLSIYAGTNEFLLAYMSDVIGYTEAKNFVAYTVFADANSGDILYKESAVDYTPINKVLTGHNGGQQSVTVEQTEDNGNVYYSLTDSTRHISVYKPIDKYFWYLDGNAEILSWKENETPDESGVDALANTTKAYDYFKDLYYNSYEELKVYVHIEDLEDEEGRLSDKEGYLTDKNGKYFGNAFRYGDILFFSVVDEEYGTAEESAHLDTVAHEYTHYVSGKISDFKSVGDKCINAAINEAYSDIFGELVEDKYYSYGTDWTHGSRSLKSPENGYLAYYDKDFVIEDPGDCYELSTIVSHAAYLMWQGIDGKGAIDNTEILGSLWYNSLFMLNGDSDFSNCRTAVEISAERLLERGVLNEEQVNCVSLAFSKVGIGESVTYDVVALNPELHVYAANNSEYYNYHYKIEKISVINLFSVGKAVEADIEIVEEGDVTDEKVINLTTLKPDTSHKCAYRITISDLSDEPGETQTKFVVVSDAQDANGVLTFYTDYVPPVGELLEKVNTALDDVKSVHLSQNTISNYSVMGSSVNMGVSLESDINITNGIMHTDMTTKYGGRNISNEIYVKTNGNTSDIYMSTSGMWVKQTGISVSDLYKLGSGFEGVDGIKFYLNSMENVYFESDSDEQNHIISGVIGSKATEEALKKAGLSTIIDQLDDDDEISDSDIQSMLSNLAPMKVTFLINKDTMLPTQMTIDMRDTTDSIYSNMKSIAAKYGESISYSITTNKAVTDFSRYNDLSEIFIPDEAANGTDYKIIK